MFEVTENATNELGEFFKDKEVKPIRIFLNQGGWGGPSLAMALDEPKDTDKVYDIDNFQYIIDQDFIELAKPISVDFVGMGFKITSGLKLEAPGDGCSGCGSNSSCG